MSSQSKTVQIYVALLNEGTDVWRPVQAVTVEESIYQVAPEQEPDSDETWEFQPGDFVRCELKTFSDGQDVMTATEIVADVI
jgi:hypothetical protein